MAKPPEMREEDRRVIAGQFYIGDVHWGYVERDGKLDLWSLDEEVTVPQIAAASRDLRALHPAKPSAIRVRTVPAPYEAMNAPVDWDYLRPEYDRMLIMALRFLGVGANGYDTGGMPSEYRGWMFYASTTAQKFLAQTASESTNFDLRHLADEIVMGTSAVAFSMRYGRVTLPWVMAVALAGLRNQMPQSLSRDLRRELVQGAGDR